MFIEVLIIYLIYSKISNRKLKFAENIEIEYAYIILLGFVMQLLPLIIIFMKKDSSFYNIYKYIHILGYFLVFIATSYNYKLGGFKFISGGLFLNLLVIIVNSGKMPVSSRALEFAGLIEKMKLLERKELLTHEIMNVGTRLGFLGDIIPLARPYPFPKVISIGDIFIVLGLIIFMVSASENKKE